MDDLGHPVWDADNHYYEALDAFTRHLDPAVGPALRPVGDHRRAEVPRGRRQGQPGGDQPTFDPIAKPGVPAASTSAATRTGSNPLELLARPRADPARVPRPRRPRRGARRAGPGRLLAVPDPRHDLRGAAAARPGGRVPSRSAPSTAGSTRTGASTTRAASSRRPTSRSPTRDWAVERARVGARPGRPPDRHAARRAHHRDGPRTAPSTRCSIRSGRASNEAGHRRRASTPATAATSSNGYALDGFAADFQRGGLASLHQELRHRGGRPRLPALDDAGSTTSRRFPNLRIASVENGAEFLPDLFRKLRSQDKKMPGYFAEDPVEHVPPPRLDQPVLGGRPGTVVEQMGADRVIFGSDWPHIEALPAPARLPPRHQGAHAAGPPAGALRQRRGAGHPPPRLSGLSGVREAERRRSPDRRRRGR